jgi:hypothetical protein
MLRDDIAVAMLQCGWSGGGDGFLNSMRQRDVGNAGVCDLLGDP